ncbi:MAG: hypothetical protein H6836_04220 [Planctomycetes bacterium]|nr:hypothetical protein [Planctomycetota bacterium]
MDVEELLDACSDTVHGLPRPRWDEVRERIDRAGDGETERDGAWSQTIHAWIRRLAAAMQPPATVTHSEQFTLVACAGAEDTETLFAFFETALAKIQVSLPSLVDTSRLPHLLVVLFETWDGYYDYVDLQRRGEESENEIAASGGMFLRRPVPHYVSRRDDLGITKTTAAHELTHFCLSQLELPLWLDEGIARTLEAVVEQGPALSLDASRLQQHRDLWDVATIQQFWSGRAWTDPVSSELAYELARMAVCALVGEPNVFVAFVRHADWRDAGQSAFQRTCGTGLEGLITQFFGPGSWAPDSRRWDLGAGDLDAEPSP